MSQFNYYMTCGETGKFEDTCRVIITNGKSKRKRQCEDQKRKRQCEDQKRKRQCEDQKRKRQCEDQKR